MPLVPLQPQEGESEAKQEAAQQLPEQRGEMAPYKIIRQLDPEEQQTVQDFMNGDKVEVFCELNDEGDFKAGFINKQGRQVVARVSECITINGVMWPLQPGRNVVPRPVYEFLVQCQTAKERFAPITPKVGGICIGEWKI